jgi:ankyrin repeat protein
LVAASRQGYYEVVDILLAAGADVHDKDGEGKDALMWASSGDHARVARALLSKPRRKQTTRKAIRRLFWELYGLRTIPQDVDKPPHCERDTDAQIDITPEMVEAGNDVISSNWIEFIYDSELFGEILSLAYKAMNEARSTSPPSSHRNVEHKS